jgi:hypothetical protein
MKTVPLFELSEFLDLKSGLLHLQIKGDSPFLSLRYKIREIVVIAPLLLYIHDYGYIEARL